MAQLNGYVKLYRSFLEWEWHDDPATVTVFVHLLLMANYTPSEWRGISLQPGQIITGRKALSEKTGLTERQIRTALTRLKSSNCVTIETTNQFSKISFINWEKYQVPESITTSETPNNLTSERPASDQPATNERPQRKKYKNARRQEEKEESVSAKRFTPPTVEEVKAYCAEIGSSINAEYFVDYYTANGWKAGKNPMRDWRATVRNWTKREGGFQAASKASAVQKGFRPVPTQEEYLEGVDPSGFGWA